MILSVREDDQEAAETIHSILHDKGCPLPFRDLKELARLGRRGRDAILRQLALRKLELHSYGLQDGSALIGIGART